MNNYCFSFDTRCIIDDDNIILRKGVWNTIDGIIPKNILHNKEYFISLMEKLAEGSPVSDKDISALDDADKEHIEEMRNSEFLVQCPSDYSYKIIDVFSGQNYNKIPKDSEFTLITDAPGAENLINSFKETYHLKPKIIEKNIINELEEINLFTRTNAIEYENKIAHYRNLLGTNPIFVLLAKPNLFLLRNLNKLADQKSPLFIGLIDAPFMIFLSIIPHFTACWDCFEQRMLSVLKDHVLYEKFSRVKHNTQEMPIYNLHIAHLVHIGLQEIITWNEFKMSKMMGRAFFIYLPTFEYHFNDILRISSCPACGYMSKEAASSNYINLKTMITQYTKEMEGGK